MTRPSPETLAELERLEKASTPGPELGGWCWKSLRGGSFCDCCKAGFSKADAKLIAAMRNEMPSLLAYIRDLERAVGKGQMYRDALIQRAESPSASTYARADQMHDELVAALAALDRPEGGTE